MISFRMLSLVLLTVGGYLLWYSGEWRPLVARFPALAEKLGIAPASADELPVITTDRAMIETPAHVATWRDADGVVHFAEAGSIPPGASEHSFGKSGTMADYEKALEDEEGITMEHIYKAQQARLQREQQEQAAAAAPAAAPATAAVGNGDAVQTATSQAYELMRQQQAKENAGAAKP